MKYLIEIDSLQNLRLYIEEYLERMVDDKYLEGELDYFPQIKIKVIEEE